MKQISTCLYDSKNTPPTHKKSYSITCAQIKGTLGKDDKNSFFSKSGPTCNDYLLTFLVLLGAKEIGSVPSWGDRLLTRSITLKTNVQKLLMVAADQTGMAGFQSSHSQHELPKACSQIPPSTEAYRGFLPL